VKAHRADHHIATMCRVLGVSTSGYYAWQRRAPSARAQQDAALTMKIHTIHIESRGTYGAPRVHAELAAQGLRVGRKRVARLMRAARVQGVSRRKPIFTTVRDRAAQPASDLVQRHFQADGPDRLWVADITYVPTWAGFLYLAVVLDAWSRRVVGWAMATHLRTELVLAALDMAIGQRLPRNVIHHSDHGCQYTSITYGQRCREFGVRPSMGSVGDAYDNAMCESFFATLECELLDRVRFRTPAAARMAIFEFIEGWYNPRRRHSALTYESPTRFEEKHAREGVAAPTPGRPRAVEPLESTIGRGAAMSVSPQSGPTTSVLGSTRVHEW
jgi:putative transposase